ncbi:hypothetical protein PVAND_002376 [Polypedilum vanderplanki]|uniref:Uncharacterized protein n=1 Tax=Polypedilum vanderplanki TaxID=319348 RepID=A0A9J6BR62_POLVA|nr:hypothetical protein PVAND_002376 [Polypedilum vanderplanki]
MKYFPNNKQCNQTEDSIIGKFFIDKSKWIQFERLDKFYDFNQCEIVVGVSLQSGYFIDYSKIDRKYIGMIPDVLDIVSKKYNFRIFYQEIFLYLENGMIKYSLILNEKNEFKIPDMIIKQASLFGHNSTTSHAISLGIEDRMIFAITPGELYTTYEKLLLPFDFTTWIFLILTFITAFSFISMFNLASRNVKDLIYGKSIKHPALNVVSIFFGIALKKIAKENASRILLILFIWFCLIFRTCYQSKMFEFITSEMRKPSPQTIDELFEQNFTIITQEINRVILQGLDPWQRSKIQIVDHETFNKIRLSLTIMYNSSAKLALLTNEDNIRKISNFNSRDFKKVEIPILNEVFCTFLNIFSFEFSEIFLDPINDLIRHLIPAGIPQHSFAYQRFLIVDRNVMKFEKKPQVFDIKSLSFGFIIWLIVLSSSFLVFLGEIFVHRLTKEPIKVKKKFIKVKFAKIHPMIEKERLTEIQTKIELQIEKNKNVDNTEDETIKNRRNQ